jgi:hypothetical protein
MARVTTAADSAGAQAEVPMRSAASQPAPAAADVLSWDSARVRDLATQIEAEERAKVDPERVYARTKQAVTKAFRDRFSKGELHSLASSFASTPKDLRRRSTESWTHSQILIYEALFDAFLETGDREGLVTLLSTRCQPFMYFYTEVELYLALHGKRLKDPVLVLDEAYSKCRTPEVRRVIAEAVRQAFMAHAIVGRDDHESVANAMEWYRRHRDRLVDNTQAYGENTGGVLGGKYEKHPLFILGPPKADASARPKGKPSPE